MEKVHFIQFEIFKASKRVAQFGGSPAERKKLVRKTREEAKDRIKQDDDERRMLRQKHGQPFEHHKYMISESVGYAEWDVDDGYELSFDELCNEAFGWIAISVVEFKF